MKFKQCNAPFSRYEMSQSGVVRCGKLNRNRNHCLKPARRGSKKNNYYYSMRKDNGEKTTVSIEVLLSATFNGLSFQLDSKWYQKTCSVVGVLNNKNKKSTAFENSTLPTEDGASHGSNFNWNDANNCPLG